MSTLATTNIKNPSSGTNNIVLETNGDVAVDGNLKKLDGSPQTVTGLGILGGIVSVIKH